MAFNEDDEIKMLSGCVPRRKEVLINGYGIIMVRNAMSQYNKSEEYSKSKLAYEGNFSTMSRYAAEIAETEYAMGAPLERVRFFLRLSAEDMLKCAEWGVPLEKVDITVEVGEMDLKTGALTPKPEKLVEVKAYADDSLRDPVKLAFAVYSALLGHDRELAGKIESKIRTNAPDVGAYVAAIRGDYNLAQRESERAGLSTPRCKLIHGIAFADQMNFNLGLRGVLDEYEKEMNINRKFAIATRRKAGKSAEAPPTRYFSIECLGGALLGLKRGLTLSVEHQFIPRELLEGCI